MDWDQENQYYRKAMKYDWLSQYYKYIDPLLHVNYYQRHLEYLKKDMEQQQVGKIRFVHTMADVPEVDIFINNLKMYKHIPSKEITNHLPLPAGDYQIDVYPAGNAMSSLISRKVHVEPGKAYTLMTAGTREHPKSLVVKDKQKVPTGEASFNFIHLSHDTGAVDLAVKNRDVVFSDITFKKSTKHLAIFPMTIELELRKAHTKEVILPLEPITFEANRAYSIVLTGHRQGDPPLSIMIVH